MTFRFNSPKDRTLAARLFQFMLALYIAALLAVTGLQLGLERRLAQQGGSVPSVQDLIEQALSSEVSDEDILSPPRDRGGMWEDMKPHVLIILSGAVLNLVLLCLIFLVLAKVRFCRPLEQFAEAAQALDMEDLKTARPRFPRSQYREFNMLESAFEKVVTGLQDALDVQRAAQERLRVSEEKFRALADNSSDTIMRFDLEGRHLYVNPAVERDTGIPASEFMHKTHGEMGFPPDLVELWEESIQRAMQTQSPVRVEFQLPNGLWKDWLVAPEFTRGGEVGAVISFARDITERKANEEMIIQAEKMLSVGGLAAGMAHEINNPLAGMMQNAQVISHRLSARIPANERAAADWGTSMDAIAGFMEQRDIFKLLEEIRLSGRKAAFIVDNLSMFSGPEGLSMSPQDLKAVIDRAVDSAAMGHRWSRRTGFQDIQVTRDYDPDLGDVVCEPAGVQQALHNILNNAAQSLSMRTKNGWAPAITITARRDGGWVRICIEDNGPGIPAEVRQHMFEPFFTTRDVGEGPGLGLSVAYFIVTELHGGAMDVNSEPGGGVSVIVSLPLKQDSKS